ncbi:MAG: lysophospholipid acyltransferase family protein [Planctomycetota bacterium]
MAAGEDVVAAGTGEPPPAEPGAPAGQFMAPQGSGYDAVEPRRRSRSPMRRLRGWVSRTAAAFAALVFPRIYMAYCWLVWRTSRVDDAQLQLLLDLMERHGGLVGCLWHQEVFTVAYGYRALRPSTLASAGNFGRIITRMLELCDFEVFRGGSSSARTRRVRVLPSMIAHMKRNPRVLYGITVDGSKGPAYVLKAGSAVIARSCRVPVLVVRTWFSNRILLPTWDRTAIPLPFGRIKTNAVGPYWIAPDASAEELERFRLHIERELLDLAELTFQEVDPRGDRGLFPPDFVPRWTAEQRGIPSGPHDLKLDDPPPWARRAGDPPQALTAEDEAGGPGAPPAQLEPEGEAAEQDEGMD